MKKLLPLVTGLLLMCGGFAQQQNKNVEGPDFGIIYCEEFHITKPLRELAAENPIDEKSMEEVQEEKIRESKDRDYRKPNKYVYTADKDGEEYGTNRGLLQTDMGSRDGKAPIMNWLGVYATGFRPNDPSGAAGTTYYMQATNATTYRITNKSTGTTVLTGSVGSLWSPSTPNDGDPIIMYDRYADRWFVSQFGVSGNKIYIAISTTNNPTGSYYTYTFTSPQFPDYLKFSIWQDGYYMTSNQSQKVFAFERSAMLAGSPTAKSIYKTFSPPQGGGFFVPLPGDNDGSGGLAPAGTPCPIFSYSDNGWGGGNIDAIQIYQMSVNWSGTPSATITNAGPVPTNAFDGSYNSSWNDISQPGTSQKLDGIGGVLNYRAQYTRWAGYNSVVLTWGVKISASQRSVMWCELRQNQSTGVWSMYQQGVFTPDTYSRWNGSIAMDDYGNIALCYAKSGSSTVYPCLGYTGRLSSDPLNTMTFTETIAQAGTGSQTGTNRFGDYSQTTLDPDGYTFWHTNEYMGGSTGGSAARTRVYSFQLQVPNPVAGVTIASDDADNAICAGTMVTFTAYPQFGGTAPAYQWYVNGSPVGTNSSTYSTSSLANGDVVTCVMTSNYPGVTGNPATSNGLTFTVGTPPATPTASSNSPVCATQSINLTTPSVGGATYNWTGPNSYSSSQQNPTITGATLLMSGTYNVTVTVNGCTSSPGSVSVTVNATPPGPTAGSNSPICEGATLNLSSSTVSGATYNWTGPASFTATTQNASVPSVTTANAGTYSVTVTVAGCVSPATNVSVTVNPTPATPTITLNGSTFSSSSATGNQWYLNGNPIAGATNQTYTPTQNGTYTVVVTQNGCSSASSSGFDLTNVGIEEHNPMLLSIFPNPNDGKFTISFSSAASENYTIQLTNDIGQIVFKQQLNDFTGAYSKQVDLGDHATGVYTLTLTNSANEIFKKILVY